MEIKNYFAQDEHGNILPNASVYLYKKGTNKLVDIFDKNGIQKENPFTAESNGLAQFQASDGEYDLRISSGGRDYTISIRLIDTLRLHFEHIARNIGCTLADGSFEDGAIISDITQLVLEKSSQKIFQYTGVISENITINAGTDPVVTLNWNDVTNRTFIASSVSSMRAMSGMSAHIGRKIYLVGYYDDTPGIGGGDIVVTDDKDSADNSGTIFVTVDGVRLKRQRKMRVYSADFGVIGDWDGSTGTDNKVAIEKMIAASNSSQPWCINQDNVGVSSISISGKDNWVGIVSGSIFNISVKPVEGASDEKDVHGGIYPTFKITNCNRWKTKGSYVDNRYREAFYITNCSKFNNEMDIKGSSLNNNLKPNYYRFCTKFKIRNFKHEGMSEKPNVSYYSWCGDIWLWDCSNYKIIDFEIHGGGGNGIYIGSNCYDFTIDDFIIDACAMSGIQAAWSSFGTFPYRGGVSNGTISGCRADSMDWNNTNGSRAYAKLTITNIRSVNNGYNDDGTVTADGSGLATLKYVTHVDIIGCHTEDPARAGLYIYQCNNVHTCGGSIRKEKTSNNAGEGVYIQDSDDISTTGLDVAMASGKEALKLYGACARMRLGGKFKGVISIPTPDAKTSYDDVKLKDATLITPLEIQGYITLVDCKVIAESSNGLRVFKEAINTDVKSYSGIGTVFGATKAKVRGGKHQGSNSGTYCGSLNGCVLDGAECIGGSGPASHWSSAINPVITNNQLIAGTGNSLLTDSSCTGIVKFGNTLSGAGSLGGTFNINY